LKQGDSRWLPSYAALVRDQATRHEALACLFGPNVTLVPVPSSNPLAPRVWAAERLAVALCGVRLGQTVWCGIQRQFAVRKSATALNADRPTLQQHYESFCVTAGINPPRRVVLVDDVITKGRTILAAAIRLHEALPDADIRAFAMVRTMGDARREP
jgi:predicted amidophosphoribosyltransferase